MSIETRPLDPLAWIDTEEAIMENAPHTRCRFESTDALWWKFRDQDAYVGSGLAIQIDKDDPGRQVSPDIFVALRPPPGGFPPFPHMLRSWKIWEFGVPTVVLEITSRSTVANDQGTKFADYQDMGVEEYYLFDPCFSSRKERSLPTPLLGYRREGGELTPLPVASSYESDLLGVRLEVAGGANLVFHDLATGRRIEPTLEVREIRSRLEADNARLMTENVRLEARLNEVAQEVARLRARVEDLERE